MNIRFSKLMFFYFVFTAFFTLGSIGYGTYYFWSNGASDFNKISNVYKANTYFDELATGEELKSIQTEVTSDGIRKAIKNVDKLYSKVERVNLLAQSSEFPSFSKDYKNAKKEMLKLVSYPEVSSIVSVLNRKISSFHRFVSENNWRTLTRMSKRLKVKTSVAGKNIPHFYMYNKLASTYRFIKKYQEKMITITGGSILSGDDKKRVTARLRNFDVELKLFKGFLFNYKGLSTEVRKFGVSYGLWINETRPNLANMKFRVESNSQNFYFGLAGFVVAIFLLSTFGFKIHKNSLKENQRITEEGFLKIIRDGLIPFKSTMSVEGSESFMDEYNRYKDYFHKRMSFGAIFQEAVPFPSILLDSNLNLVWANKLFYEDWKVSNVNDSENTVTWDYLQKFTNLGEDDPVFSAINQGLAGIYQIQLKLEDSDSPSPFEMYVTPISYMNQKRVMIFFYPLGSLEETLSNQRKSMVGPIIRTVEAMNSNKFNEDFIDKIKSDFEAAGIPQIYDKFLTYNEQRVFERNTFSTEVGILQGNLTQAENAFNQLSEKVNFISENNIDQKKAFELFKNNIISVSEINANLKGLVENVFSQIGNVISLKGNIEGGVNKLNQTLLDNKKVLDAISGDKVKIKEFKTDLDNLKYSFRKKSATIKGTDENEFLKGFFKQLDQTLDRFGKTLSHLDMTISKANIIIGDEETIDYSKLFESMDTLEVQHRNGVGAFNSNVGQMQTREDALISSLQSSFENYIAQKGGISDMGSIIATHVIEQNPSVAQAETTI